MDVSASVSGMIASSPLFPARFASDSDLPERLAAIVDCLMETNKKFNLTAITDPEGIVAKHILDSLLAAEAVAEAVGTSRARLLDVGSGAGFPGMPIAAACPRVAVTALDSTAKKCAYMNETAATAGIANFTALCGRAEEVAHLRNQREFYDFVTARAVANLPVLCELCLPFVREGGTFFALKGVNALNEIANAATAMAKLGGKLENSSEYHIPGDEAPRYILTIRKISPTPDTFPRHYSQITKKPL